MDCEVEATHGPRNGLNNVCSFDRVRLPRLASRPSSDVRGRSRSAEHLVAECTHPQRGHIKMRNRCEVFMGHTGVGMRRTCIDGSHVVARKEAAEIECCHRACEPRGMGHHGSRSVQVCRYCRPGVRRGLVRQAASIGQCDGSCVADRAAMAVAIRIRHLLPGIYYRAA